MSSLGTPLSPSATRLLMLGAGELGKEVVIEAQRLGVEVVAADRYPNAPAMQVAHRSHVLNMLDPQALRDLVMKEQPALIVPEIEAIATTALLDLEREGFRVIPTARAARLTMDREGIRRLAAEELGLATSPYRFADDEQAYRDAVTAHRLAVRREAGDEFVGQGPERRQQRGRRAARLGLRPAGRPGRRGPRHRRGIHPLRLRDHAADRAARAAARASARRSATCRSTATTASRGSRSR